MPWESSLFCEAGANAYLKSGRRVGRFPSSGHWTMDPQQPSHNLRRHSHRFGAVLDHGTILHSGEMMRFTLIAKANLARESNIIPFLVLSGLQVDAATPMSTSPIAGRCSACSEQYRRE